MKKDNINCICLIMRKNLKEKLGYRWHKRQIILHIKKIEFKNYIKKDNIYKDMSDTSQDKEIKEVKMSVNEKDKLKDIMRDLEKKVNPKSSVEGMEKLSKAVQTNDASILLDPIAQGAKEFEERVGRKMTYVEMRLMWG